MTVLMNRTMQETRPLTILQRIGNDDRTAVKDCVDAYGNFIWALAKKFTASPEEAEAAAQEIFTDIWRYAERGEKPASVERVLIGLIARRRLITYLQ